MGKKTSTKEREVGEIKKGGGERLQKTSGGAIFRGEGLQKERNTTKQRF